MNLLLTGRYRFEVWTPDRCIQVLEGRNGITVVGINDMFLQYLKAGTGVTPSIGLIDKSGFTEVSSGDTMASHAGWQEITEYSEATRVAWSPEDPSSRTITNSVKAQFNMTAAKDAKGFFLCSDSTKGGTTGILFNTALFDVSASLQPGQVGKAVYSLTGTPA